MDTGGNIEEAMSEEHTRSLSIYVNYCNLCQYDDIQIQAEGFCVDCNDYLCSYCYKAHKRNKASSNHLLQDRETMPVRKPTQLVITEKCPIHENEHIKWYCKSHDVVFCNMCQAVQHRKCENVKTITDESASIFDSADFMKVKGQLTILKEEFIKHLTCVRENVREVQSIYTKVLDEIIRILTTVKNKDIEHLKLIESTCDASLKTIMFFCAKLETLENNGMKAQAFLTKRKAGSQLSLYGQTLNSVKDDNKITKYRFVPTPPYIQTDMIGTLCKTRHRRTPVKLGNINMKTSSDTDDCCITGINRLDGNRLVVADTNNSKLKLVDVNSENVTAEIKLDETPWELTKIDNKNIAVTAYGGKKVLLVSVSDRLSVKKSIDKGHYIFCQGIVYDKDSLAVSYHNPDQIQILDLNGTVKQTIENKDNDGIVKFGDVEYIAKNPDTDTLYLSDRTHDKVLSMTHDGKIMSSFSHEDLKLPKGITVGKDGRIYVCSYSTNKIYKLSSDLSKGEIILDQQNGIQNPTSIVFDDEKYKLYIGSKNNNNIQVFLV